jgi:hypothetical protein
MGDRHVASLVHFQTTISELANRARSFDIRAYEVAPVERVMAELQPATLRLLADARALLGSILDTCQHVAASDWIAEEGELLWSASYLPFERALDATMGRLGSHEAVDEIAFVAQLELRQRELRLERVRPQQGIALVLGECDSSLRRTRKALTAVDVAIATLEGVAPALSYESECTTSLAVRRAYAKFRARVMSEGEPSTATLRARLRGAGTQIAMFVGWEVYPDVRVQDRLLLRDLQRRILDWLRQGNDASAAEGLRVWQDLAAFMEMLRLVNRRQELVEHDTARLRELGDALARDALADTTLVQLRTLEGLDDELDAALERPEPDPVELRGIMARLAAQILPSHRSTSGGDAPW